MNIQFHHWPLFVVTIFHWQYGVLKKLKPAVNVPVLPSKIRYFLTHRCFSKIF